MKSRLTVGERVAWYRRRRGLSQEALAGLVGRTADWLQTAERNRISLDRVSVLRDLADVLGVTVAHLLGDEGQLEPRRSREFDITAIRMALTSYGQVLEPSSVRSVERLEMDLDALWEAYQDSRFGYMALRLPALVNEVRAAAACPTGRDRGRAAEIVSLTYQAATALLTKLGDVDLAWVSADRGLHTAHQTGNPVIIGSLSRSVVHALQSTGRHEEAVALVDSTASFLGVNLRRADRVSISVYGSLFLAGAVAAARLGDRSIAQTYLARAEAAADEMPGDDNALWTSFGPTNVAIHRVTAMMEFGDASTGTGPGCRARHLEPARRASRAPHPGDRPSAMPEEPER
jgi:transcriptional regulator with XRE-family HTH domain